MSLQINTFSNVTGGETLFKALGHPLVAERAPALLARLTAGGPLAVYDAGQAAGAFGALYGVGGVRICGVYVDDAERVGAQLLGHVARPLTRLRDDGVTRLLVTTFDTERLLPRMAPLLPDGVELITLQALRLPDDMLADPHRYLNPLNFATNLAFFRDTPGQHTRLVTANYWAGYGARGHGLWCRLFDGEGRVLATWEQPLDEHTGTVLIDSREIRARFGLGDFAGSLFVHALRAVGHDVVKYALDTFGDEPTVLSCTHDANAWPADLYAGIPAPAAGERVVVWLQNGHPCPVPAGAVGLACMGSGEVQPLGRAIAPFGMLALDVGELMPQVAWPAQLELHAGRHVVRPRYEVIGATGRARIAHANVERTDLDADPQIPRLGGLLGKGWLLPAPVLPVTRFRTVVLPTPMATRQHELPVQLSLYDPEGREVARHRPGRLARAGCTAVEVDELLRAAGEELTADYGHVELRYDFDAGQYADGWLHALFRYHERSTGHAADTSFGAHVFNTALVYRNEPQSYHGTPPGLSTRLFLRIGHPGSDTLCQLIYPASLPWRPYSDTALVLHDSAGEEVARRVVNIACSGSLLWRYSEMFDAKERARAGDAPWLQVRDRSCRLFGYHGLIVDGAAFSLDHMFGF